MEPKPTFAIHTLGCKLNYSESSAIARQLAENGFNRVPFKEKADIYIINTCSVTQEADRECRSVVRSAMNVSPGAFVAVTGCYAQLKPEEIAKMQGVDLVLGASEKFNIIKYLQYIDKKEFTEIHSCEIEQPLEFHTAYSSGERTRSFLKVQDGCDYNCSYCTIPLARGRSRSGAIENVLKNVYEIASKGIREIVLTGVNLGDFGKNKKGSDLRDESFFELVQELERINVAVRFRISSIEPNLLTEDIIWFVSESKKFVPHFHIPLQSGCNEILKKMRRRYLRELYAEKVSLIKTLMPHCCIGADVITGFPGESEENFMETFSFIHELEVSYLHVFTFSERSNTHAVDAKNFIPIPKEIRKKRTHLLRILSQKKLQRFYTQNLGQEREVLLEETNDNAEWTYGYSDNYIRVRIKRPVNLMVGNQINNVVLCAINSEGTVDGDIPVLISNY